MIKNGEKKNTVCRECVTLMTPTDYREHGGLCQLCRGEATSNLYHVQRFDDDGDVIPYLIAIPKSEQHDINSYVRRHHLDNYDTDEYVDGFDIRRVDHVDGYDVVLIPR